MDTAKVFKSGRSQAVRLPKEYRFSRDEVAISRLGETVLLFPKNKAWDVMSQAVAEFTPDYMSDRAQPTKADRRKSL